jgi:putative acyl-CoA dehydrogenase
MRAALARALHHARERSVFGQPLVDQPLMRNVLADIALEVEAATWLALRLARAFEGPDDSAEHAFARLVTPAAKYWVCKRGPALAAEAMEVLGGNGYIEASGLPRLYRELPVNSIWEGSGNVMCLDVARTVARERTAVEALLAELARARGRHRLFDAASTDLRHQLGAPIEPQHARRITQSIALLLQAALLLQHAPEVIADAFCASRLAPDAYGGAAFGSLRGNAALERIVARAAGS